MRFWYIMHMREVVLNTNGLVPSLARSINVGMHLYSHPSVACACSEGSGQADSMCSCI